MCAGCRVVIGILPTTIEAFIIKLLKNKNMPYDLYGTYYASARDAENAEMAQCAAIDADIANRKVAELEKKIYEQKQPELGYEEQLYYMSQHIQSLEERIFNLENFLFELKK